ASVDRAELAKHRHSRAKNPHDPASTHEREEERARDAREKRVARSGKRTFASGDDGAEEEQRSQRENTGKHRAHHHEGAETGVGPLPAELLVPVGGGGDSAAG